MLGFVDLGAALFAPVLGGVIVYFDHTGFTQMFYTSSATAVIIAVIYALTSARQADEDSDVQETVPLSAGSVEIATEPSRTKQHEHDELLPAFSTARNGKPRRQGKPQFAESRANRPAEISSQQSDCGSEPKCSLGDDLA